MGKIKTAKRQTIWNVINIKSRGIQTPQTYIHAFECLKDKAMDEVYNEYRVSKLLG